MEGLLIAIGSVVVIIRWVYLRDRMNAIERRLYVLECSYTASPAVAWHPPAAPPPPRPASPPARAPEPAAAAPPPPPVILWGGVPEDVDEPQEDQLPIVTDINGIVLDDYNRGLQAFEALGEATMANVTVLRDGSTQVLVIDTRQLQNLQPKPQP